MATILTKGSTALILDATGTTVRAGFMALQDIDLDLVFAGDVRLADLAGMVEQVPLTYWLGWAARHPEFDWKAVFAQRLVTEFQSNRFRRFTVAV